MTDARVTPVVLCIDVEPDDRKTDRDAPCEEWSGVLPTVEIIERWRDRLTIATERPAQFVWFWRADPQIAETHGDAGWGLERYRSAFEATSARGDEHGVHPHTWRWQPSASTWIQDWADPAWVQHCIDLSLDTFERVTGRRCELSRLGDRSLGEIAYRCLARRHVRIDLSVEPGELPIASDSITPRPDYTNAPTGPYRPRRGDIARPSRTRRGPLLLPLTATVGAAPEGHGMRLRTIHPWEPDAPALTCALLDREALYLAFAMRSDMGVTPAFLEPFEALLGALAEHERRTELAFVGPMEAACMLRRRRSPQRRSGPDRLGNFRPSG